MEQPITIVALALSIAGLSYLKVQQIERMVMAEEAAIAQAIQDSTAAADAAEPVSYTHLTLPTILRV